MGIQRSQGFPLEKSRVSVGSGRHMFKGKIYPVCNNHGSKEGFWKTIVLLERPLHFHDWKEGVQAKRIELVEPQTKI